MTYFNSRRSTLVARQGAVATSQPLAAQAGLQILMMGGNAIDAAVAAAATLAVLEPLATGPGGDVFCLIWSSGEKRVVALNGSGRAPIGIDVNELLEKNYQRIPSSGPEAIKSITVPGAVDGWQTALETYGSMTLKEVLQPAINYARDGFGVTEIIAQQWQEYATKLSVHPSGAEFLPVPQAGDMVYLPTLADTLEIISEEGKEAFYFGELADKIANFVQSQGGCLTAADLSMHTSTWEEPISTTYRDITIWECPPNGQGLTALLALNIAEQYDLSAFGPQSVDRYHYLIEAMRLGFADGLQYIADPAMCSVPVEALLSKNYAKQRRKLINSHQAMSSTTYGDMMVGNDTVYISAVDSEGNACSFINSLYEGFGSGFVVPGTGILLHNRGACFSLDPKHPNYLQPYKRPYHTIIPAIATIGPSDLWLSFGIMGGYQQPQGHLQVLSNLIDFNMTPQQALDALRFKINLETGVIGLEAGLSPKTVTALSKRGHRVEVIDGYTRADFGGGQIIARDRETGMLLAGSDPRKDGVAIGF